MIFEGNTDSNVEFSSSVMSFKDCPNRCVDGYYIDPYLHKKKECLFCKERRRKMVKSSLETKDGDNVYDVLNLPRSFVGDNFDRDSVIPEFAKKDMIASSISIVLDEMQSLYYKITAGEVPDYSILFNLGKRAFENNFIYPYMLRAYQAGVLISPYITDYDVRMLYDGEESTISGVSYKDLVKTDVCIINILAGSSVQNIRVVKGLMEFRAHYSKSTIVVTNTWNRYVRELCTEDDVRAKSLACLFSIEYTEKYIEKEEKKRAIPGYSDATRGLTSKEFQNLMR